jgi:hypothetical protein
MFPDMLTDLLHGAKKVFAKKFLYDIVKTFIGVFLAFQLAQWNANRQSNFSEKTVLTEIKKDLVLDLTDMTGNLEGHKKGKEACAYFWRAIHGKPFGEDSLRMHYHILLRSFTSIQHSAAYESVKFRGLEIIKDDSLRMNIINLFDFELEGLTKLEENYTPHDFLVLYYDKMNAILMPHIHIDEKGKWSVAIPFAKMAEKDRQAMKQWLQQIKSDRQFMMMVYEDAIKKATELQRGIDGYLGK